MISQDNYLFVDGSSLLADINRLWMTNEAYKNRRLDIKKFCAHFAHTYPGFVNGYRRLTIYFVKGESRIERFLVLPDFKAPNAVEDLHIRYCGRLLEGGAKLQSWLDENSPPQFVTDRLNKAEKAVDTQICCDALQLAAPGRLDRLLLYTNDYDYMPLLHTLKAMGCNASLFQLTSDRVNSKLVENCDSFHVPSNQQLDTLFESPSGVAG